MRLEESGFLAKDHPLASIYICGYAAEMTIKAAYFKNLGLGALAEIDRDLRNRAISIAQLQGFLGNDPHDILGWARLLIWDKEHLHTPAYAPKLSSQFIVMATIVYENWRPQMRYKNTSPSLVAVTAVRTATAWLVENYAKM